MTTHATGTFTMKHWDEKTWEGKSLKEAPGAKLTHAVITQTFQGDIEGEGTSQLVMIYTDDHTASFTGLQRIVGRIGKRAGSFVLQVNGTYANNLAKATWSVMPGSGTEELRGLHGKGDYTSKHGESDVPITLAYDFE